MIVSYKAVPAEVKVPAVMALVSDTNNRGSSAAVTGHMVPYLLEVIGSQELYILARRVPSRSPGLCRGILLEYVS